MKHAITEEKWFDYLDGTILEADRLSIEEHLRLCPECRQMADMMRAVDDALISAAAALRQSVTVAAGDISAAKEKALARLGDGAVPLRLGNLYLLLAPMCGVETSTRAIRAAAQRASADSPRHLEERLWPGFVEHLHAIVATLCGEPAAQLIWERGMSLQREAA